MEHQEVFGGNAITQVNSGQDRQHPSVLLMPEEWDERWEMRKGNLLFIVDCLALFKFHFLILLWACVTFSIWNNSFCLLVWPPVEHRWLGSKSGQCRPYSYLCVQRHHLPNGVVYLNRLASLEGCRWGRETASLWRPLGEGSQPLVVSLQRRTFLPWRGWL